MVKPHTFDRLLMNLSDFSPNGKDAQAHADFLLGQRNNINALFQMALNFPTEQGTRTEYANLSPLERARAVLDSIHEHIQKLSKTDDNSRSKPSAVTTVDFVLRHTRLDSRSNAEINMHQALGSFIYHHGIEREISKHIRR